MAAFSSGDAIQYPYLAAVEKSFSISSGQILARPGLISTGE
jgi:hypothetical protein